MSQFPTTVPIRTDKRKLAKLIQAANEACTRFVKLNPSRHPLIEITWRGNSYRAQCYYHDTITGSRCTFHMLYQK